MILFGAFTYRTDAQVSSQLIIGGVSLISIILTGYTAFATLDDKWHYRPNFLEEGEGGSDIASNGSTEYTEDNQEH